MAVYYTIRCPHCRRVVKTEKNRTEEYGTPFRTCQYCGKYYVDDNFIEAGCFDNAEFKKRTFSWQSIFWIFLGIAIMILGIFESVIPLIVIGLGMAGIGVASIVSYIRYVPSNDAKLQAELLQSKERLSNPNYVIALKEAGCYVTNELVKWAKKETGYKDKKDIIREQFMDDDNYDKLRYLCKSYKFLSDAGKGTCMMCFHTSELKKYKIKNDIGSREIPICEKCINRFKELNPEI